LHLVAALGEQVTSRFQDAGPVARGVGSRLAGWWVVVDLTTTIL
jgi:hypothetical protein